MRLKQGLPTRSNQCIIISSTLLVLPTAMGKTAVQWMVIAETLRRNNGWPSLAPTNALVDQQHRGLERVMNLQDGNNCRMTGAIPHKEEGCLGRS